MTARILAVHPVLGSPRVADSIAFFERLGFRCVFRDASDEPCYACVARDDIELHLQRHDEAGAESGGDRPTYRFLVDDVDALFSDFARRAPDALARSGTTPFSAPADSSWGTREFHLRDPAGHGLHFYRPR